MSGHRWFSSRIAAILATFTLALIPVAASRPALAKGPFLTVWKTVSTATAPPARAAHAMAYDPVSGKIVVFGGFGPLSYFGDTWTFDGRTWTKESPPVSPGARAAATLMYDEVTKQLVLFGGYNGLNYLDDTWLWDGAASTWTQASPATVPSVATGPMGFTDPMNGHATMFGGYNGMFYVGSTWQWNGVDWVDLQPANPPPARGAGIAALDSSLHRVVSYGGIAGVNPAGTWIWDGTDWSNAAPATAPPLSYYSCAAYDPNFGGVILFGGATGGPDLNDSWLWDGSNWTELSTGRTPAGRESAGMAYDTAQGYTVMFGGVDIQSGNGGRFFNETWILTKK
jgi:Galactose oxidase, central domain